MITASRAGQVRQLGGQSAFFLMGSIFTLVVGWPLQVYVARVLGADGLGIFTLLESFVATITGVLGLGLAPTLVRFIPQHLERQEYGTIRRLVLFVVIILLATGTLGVGVFWLSADLIVHLHPALSTYTPALILMALMIPVTLLSFAFGQGLRGFQEIRYMVLGSSFLQLLVKMVLTIALFSLGFQLMGYIWAVVISALFGACWMAVGLYRRLNAMPSETKANCSEAVSRSWRAYSWVMYTNSLVGLITGRLDIYLLTAFAGVTAVGVLAVVKTLENLPVIFLRMLITVSSPMLTAAHVRGEQDELHFLYHLANDWLVRISAPLLVFLVIFADPMLRLYGVEFAKTGYGALIILMIGQIVNLGAGSVGLLLNMCGLERQMLRVTVTQVFFQGLGFVVLIPWLGLSGAAASISAATIYMNIAALRLAKRYLGMRWYDVRFKRWLLPGSLTIAVAVIFRVLLPLSHVLYLSFVLLLLYVVFHGVYLLHGLHDDDRVLLQHIRCKFLSRSAA